MKLLSGVLFIIVLSKKIYNVVCFYILMIIKKKVWPEFFQRIVDGKKKFELRLGDFECNPGDILVLEEWNPETEQYTGREIKKEVSYVFKTKDVKFWPKEQIEKYGFQIISFD